MRLSVSQPKREERLSVQIKLSFTYDGTPVTIELQADSLSTLDSLKWLVKRVAEWIDGGKRMRMEERSGHSKR
ncbi:hypothetical protein KEJ34_03320 [Candidatus Bathyarchaeota archaeon]|nr:hypothetical protein [Candidatus Bathyarchaeota archaeon]